jgi:hypothetical protein
MISAKRLTPYLFVWLTLTLAGMSAAGWETGVRTLIAFAFLLVCPGLPWVWVLGDVDERVAVVVAIALSVAIDVVLSEAMVYLRLWSPIWAFVILTAIGGVGLALGKRRVFWDLRGSRIRKSTSARSANAHGVLRS